MHVQAQLHGGVTKLSAMVIAPQRHTAAMSIPGLPFFPKEGMSGLVKYGDQKVFRALEHSRMNRHFMEQILLLPLPPRVLGEVSSAPVLSCGQH
jgi:hypothetical protein